MMPRKKLEFYAARYGISDLSKVRLSAEEVSAICTEVGCKQYGMSDCGGSIAYLIDRVMDDPLFVEIVRNRLGESVSEVREDFITIRITDYAADAVMSAYASVRSRQ